MQGKTLVSRARITSILDFWFGEGVNRNEAPKPESFRKWFMATPEVDAEITSNFGEDLQKLNSGEYDEWKADREGRLAAVILADQFTRNMFRKRAEAFSYDHLALSIVKTLADEEFFSYQLQEQSFLVLPFEHSESLEDQDRAVALTTTLVERAESQGASEAAVKHAKGVHSYAL